MRSKFFSPFLLPNGLLFAVAAYALAQPHLLKGLKPFFEIAPVAVAGFALLLGWRYARLRLVLGVALLLLTAVALEHVAGGKDSSHFLPLLAVLLPANLLAIAWLREKGVFSLDVGLWALLVAAELLFCYWLLKYRPDLLETWRYAALFNLPLPEWLALGEGTLLLNGVVLLLFVATWLRRQGAFEASFFWAQALIFVALALPAARPLANYMTVAASMLIFGMLETSHSLAYRDELTGLPGRRALNEALGRLGRRYTVAMLDIDHFKKFNDTHGHDVGDQVLKMVASKLAMVGGGGKVFRYGGEEFAVLFPRKRLAAVLPCLEQLRQAVEEARFIPRGNDRPKKKPKKPRRVVKPAALKVTISIGAAERNGQALASAALLKAADQALYRAKKAGRNQVCS